MNIGSYLKDRLLYLILLPFHIGLVYFIAQLVLLEKQASFGLQNLFYIILLSTFFTIIVIAIDYGRQQRLYRRLNELFTCEHVHEQIPSLDMIDAPTKEQQVFKALMKRHHNFVQTELDSYKVQQKQHLTFINQWVHSMKTPLSVISLLIQEGKRMSTSKQSERLLDSIGEENERFRHGLDMMLHTASLDYFSLDMRSEKIELTSLIREVINEERKQYIRLKVFPKLIAPDGDIYIYSDRKWLRFILSQLLLNSLKYSKTATNKSIITTVSLANGHVTLTIADQGIGIPKADLPRVFEPFFTGENGRKGQESTGMGLYLVKTICDTLGHSLSIKSEAGIGTTITIEFQHNILHVSS